MNEETMTIVEEIRSIRHFSVRQESNRFYRLLFHKFKWHRAEKEDTISNMKLANCKDWQTRKMTGNAAKSRLFLHSFKIWRIQHSSHHRPVSPIHRPRVLTMSNNPADGWDAVHKNRGNNAELCRRLSFYSAFEICLSLFLYDVPFRQGTTKKKRDVLFLWAVVTKTNNWIDSRSFIGFKE
jgi:hypothetical protein